MKELCDKYGSGQVQLVDLDDGFKLNIAVRRTATERRGNEFSPVIRPGACQYMSLRSLASTTRASSASG